MAVAAAARTLAAASVGVCSFFAPLRFPISALAASAVHRHQRSFSPEAGNAQRWAHRALLQVRDSSGMIWATGQSHAEMGVVSATTNTTLGLSEPHNTITENNLRPNTYMFIGLLIKVY